MSEESKVTQTVSTKWYAMYKMDKFWMRSVEFPSESEARESIKDWRERLKFGYEMAIESVETSTVRIKV